MPAFLETDVLLDEAAAVGEQQGEGQVIKTAADRHRGLKATEEDGKKREGRPR